ncbi:MAG: helix-turn-helix domain-containing protein [Solirubrobacterales bacterium]
MSSSDGRTDLQEFRAQLVSWLSERSSLIEEAIFARVRALPDPGGDMAADYIGGLRTAVAESVKFGLMSIEQGEDWSGPAPQAVPAQARRAVRNGVSLETVLRRYRAGDRLLREFIIDSANQQPSQPLRQILSTQTRQFDRLVGIVAAEYMREHERTMRSPAQRLTERVQQTLSGVDPDDPYDLAYELDAWHMGLIALGAEAEDAVRALAAALDRQTLVVPQGGRIVWAWLGGRRELRVPDVERQLSAIGCERASLAVGEPHRGVEGWRLTHHEALAGMQVLLRQPQRLIRGSDVLLVAAVLRNEALIEPLLKTYLAPLDHAGDSDGALRGTLRAYFDADCNTVAAAAALEVNRHTVRRRLQKVENALGRLLHVCRAELEVALRLEELRLSPSLSDAHTSGDPH